MIIWGKKKVELRFGDMNMIVKTDEEQVKCYCYYIQHEVGDVNVTIFCQSFYAVDEFRLNL
jgi:hypothetical protein